MKQFRLFLQTVVLAAVALSISLQAGISPLAFNGVFKCFKQGYEMYAPNLGCAALQTGFVNALRFYTTIPGGYDAHGRRLWINDKVPADDPVADLTLLLFPSPAGNLTAMTSHPNNIGRHLTVHDVAQLLNFCARVRTAVGVIKKDRSLKGNQFGKNIKNTLKLIYQALYTTAVNKDSLKILYVNRTLDAYFRLLHIPEHFLQLPHVHILLSLLCRCIELEERDDRQNTFIENPLKHTSFKSYQHNSFYSKFTPEKLLNAFFCLKFSKDDIPELLQHLDDSIVDHNQLTEARLIDKSDIESVKKKDLDTISLDDLWVIQNRDLIDQVIPYSRGCTPVNNGLALGYNRTQDKLILNQEFPDCTETTIRHLCNLILFHKEGSFKIEKMLERLRNYSIKNLSANLQAFYVLQSPDKANSGERSVRDAWSKVASDLGDPIRYKQNTSEISSGIINIIRVLNIIFNLELSPEPIYQKDQQFVEDAMRWAENGLKKLFQIVSPEKMIYIEISGVQAFKAFGNYEYDCSGKINVTVNQDFKFTMRVEDRHAQFDTIDILVPEQALIHEDILNQVTNKFQNDFSTTIGESIFLLDNKTKDLVTTPVYTLFKNGVHDSAQIIQAFEILLEITQKNHISSVFSEIILKNLLRNFLWQDQEMSEKIQPILKKWTRFALKSNNQGMINVLQKEVKSVQYDLFCEDFNNNADNLLEFFHQATTIFCLWENTTSIFSLFKNHKSVKTINLSASNISELEISGLCPSLETLDLSLTSELNSFKLSGTLQSLKTIHFSGSVITELEISGDACPNLEMLNLSSINQLNSLKLSGTLQSLKTVDLFGSVIRELEISGICPNLEMLNLRRTSGLNSLKLSGTLQSLKIVDLFGSVIRELEISGICPNLESLDLSDTSQLKNTKLSGTCQSLKTINLDCSAIIELEISGICPSLETLILSNTSRLKHSKLSGNFQSFKTINLFRSEIENLEISGDLCPNLETLSLNYTMQLDSLKLSGIFQNLKTVDLFRSGISELEVSENVSPNIQTLDLSYTSKLKNFKLSGTFQSLKTINLYYSAIPELKINKHCCPNLQSTDSRIKIIDLKRKDRDEEIDDQEQPDAKKQCLNDIREN